MALSQEAIELLRSNEAAWQIVYNTLENTLIRGTPIREQGYIELKKVGNIDNIDIVPVYWKTFGIYDTNEDGIKKALFATISTGILEKTVVSGENYYSLKDEKFSNDLSEILIYAKANADTAQILHKHLGKRTVIDDNDGILATYSSNLIYIISQKKDDNRTDNIWIIKLNNINGLSISKKQDESKLSYGGVYVAYSLSDCSERKKQDIMQILTSTRTA